MKIYLNFIMKNEAHVLPRYLKSVLPIIDGVVCADTGSSDNSIEIVKNFCKEHDLLCKVYEIEFINFSQARNFALEKLKWVAKDEPDAFGFFLDCDEELLLKERFSLRDLRIQLSSCDMGGVATYIGDQQYIRGNFFRISKPFEWRHPVHEYLHYPNAKYVDISNIAVLIHFDGSSYSSQTQKQKYLNYARLSEEEVKKHNDPRDVFYTAQSYKDAGENELALEWYKKRVEMTDGFFEERGYSQFWIGLLSERMSKAPSQSFWEYIKSFEIDTERGEGLLNAIVLLQGAGCFNTAYVLSKYAVEKFHKKNPYPKRRLTVDMPTYSYKIMGAHIENCKRLGKSDEIQDKMNLEETFNMLCGIPSDIGYHLPKLKEYSSTCNHVTEMGVRGVVSTYALMSGRPKKLISYDINYDANIENANRIAKEENIDFTFINADVLKVEIEETDMLFIDTLHIYSQLKKELALHSGKVKKYLCFHDTTTYAFEPESISWQSDNIKENYVSNDKGLWPAIEEFLNENENWIVDYKTDQNNGLTILRKLND